ncbi:hypothetical protein BGZ58_004527 [Dissophora ornata]|nr:hypothetical protein BGZ58_004527 [Dissophora ornata]
MLQAEMAKNQELQRQMLEMQEVMTKLQQQQTLDQLAAVKTRIQAVLTQNFELHEYPIPRLFIVLPKDSSAWDPQKLLQNTLQLHFLCECGEHTKLNQDSKIPHHIHLAKHEGYEISRPIEFFGRFGSYMMVLLYMLKFGISVAGFVVPALGQSSGVGAADQTNNPLDNSLLEPGIDQAMDYLGYLLSEDGRSTLAGDARYGYKKDELEVLQGTDMRQLGTFLKRKDTNQVLGNLYRIVTEEGYAKWVCLDHYRETYNVAVIKNLSDAITVNRGTFDEFRGRVEGSLPSTTVATQFYKALEWGKFIQELKATLTWDVSLNDLKALRDVILRSNISTFDLTSTATNLRVLKITERIDWKKDGPKAVELLENCPHLKELHLSSNEIDAAYMAIKSINYDFCTLEHLTLDGGEFSGLRAQFKGGIPDAMDLVVFDLSSPLLKDVRALRSLHVRPGLYVKANFDTRPLAGIISRNSGLTKIMIQCETTDFIKLHIAVKEALVYEETSMLHTLKFYSRRNQLAIRDLQGNTSVELELLSIKAPRDVIDTLFRVYGTQLTKINIDSDVLNSLLEITRAGGTLALQHIEIETSGVSYGMLYGLRYVLQASLSTLLELVVLVDRTWEATVTERRSGQISISPYLADLVVAFGPQWTKISIHDDVAEGWAKAFEQRGFTVPEDVLKLIPRGIRLINRTPDVWITNVTKMIDE